MNLRDFLDEREREITEELADRKRQQIPYDAELAEIRRAKSALGRPKSVTDAPGGASSRTNKFRAYLEARERELNTLAKALGAGLEELINELAEVRKAKATIGSSDPPEAAGVLYQSLSIGELVVKAFQTNFSKGATIGELVDFLSDKWRQDVDRPSLSPQLSRLYKRGILGRIPSLPGWFLVPAGAGREGRRPYRNRDTGEIYLKHPCQIDERDERLLTNSSDPRGGVEPHATPAIALAR